MAENEMMNSSEYVNKITDGEVYIERPEEERVFFAQVRAIDKEILGNTPHSPHLINNFGTGGIGKTRLREFLCKEIEYANKRRRLNKSPEIKCLTIDIDEYKNDERSIIFSIVRLLFKRFNIQTFPCTCAYFKKESEQTGGDLPFPLTGRLDKILENKNLGLGLTIGSALKNEIGHIGTIKEIISYIRGMKDPNLSDWDFLKKLAETTGDNTSIEYVKKIEISHSISKQKEKLIDYFIQDLKVIMRDERSPFVFFLDTYEKHTNTINSSHINAASEEKWIQRLIYEVPQILWVICGREDLYNADKTEWEKNTPEIREIRPFSPSQIREYMDRAGVGEELFELFSKKSEGIPFFLEALCLQYHEKVNEGKEYLNEADYKFDQGDFFNRYSKQLGDENSYLFMQLSVMEGAWTKEQINAISDKLQYYREYSFEHIIHSKMVYKTSEDSYYIPTPIRQTFLSNMHDKLKKETKNVLAEYTKELIREQSIEEPIGEILKLREYCDQSEIEDFYINTIHDKLMVLISMNRIDEAHTILQCYNENYASSNNLLFKWLYLGALGNYQFNAFMIPNAKETVLEMNRIAKLLDEEYKATGKIDGPEEFVSSLRKLTQTLDGYFCAYSLFYYQKILVYEQDYDRAEQVSKEVIKIFEKVLHPYNPDKYAAYKSYADCLCYKGEFLEANNIYKFGYKELSSIYTLDKLKEVNLVDLAFHFRIGELICMLGVGEIEKAKSILKAMNSEIGKYLPKNHGIVFLCNDYYPVLIKISEGVDPSEVSYEELERVFRGLTDNRVPTDSSLILLKLFYFQKLVYDGKTENILQLAEELIIAINNIIPDYSEENFVLKESVIRCLIDCDEYDHALKYCREIYDKLSLDEIRNSESLVIVLAQMCYSYYWIGELEKAKECYGQAYNIIKKYQIELNQELESYFYVVTGGIGSEQERTEESCINEDSFCNEDVSESDIERILIGEIYDVLETDILETEGVERLEAALDIWDKAGLSLQDEVFFAQKALYDYYHDKENYSIANKWLQLRTYTAKQLFGTANIKYFDCFYDQALNYFFSDDSRTEEAFLYAIKLFDDNKFEEVLRLFELYTWLGRHYLDTRQIMKYLDCIESCQKILNNNSNSIMESSIYPFYLDMKKEAEEYLNKTKQTCKDKTESQENHKEDQIKLQINNNLENYKVYANRKQVVKNLEDIHKEWSKEVGGTDKCIYDVESILFDFYYENDDLEKAEYWLSKKTESSSKLFGTNGKEYLNCLYDEVLYLHKRDGGNWDEKRCRDVIKCFEESPEKDYGKLAHLWCILGLSSMKAFEFSNSYFTLIESVSCYDKCCEVRNELRDNSKIAWYDDFKKLDEKISRYRYRIEGTKECAKRHKIEEESMYVFLYTDRILHRSSNPIMRICEKCVPLYMIATFFSRLFKFILLKVKKRKKY